MKKLLLIQLLLLLTISSFGQQKVVDFEEIYLYSKPSFTFPSPDNIIGKLKVGTNVTVIDSSDYYYKVSIDTTIGFIMKHTLVEVGSSIQAINVELLYRIIFYLHPDLTQIQQFQQVGMVDRENYGKRLKLNNIVNDSVQKIINRRKLKMYDEIMLSNDEVKEDRIKRVIEIAYTSCQIEHDRMSRSIWNRYSEYPKLKFLPSRNSATSMMYYQQSRKNNFLSNVNIEGWDSVGSIKSNLFTGYSGPIQISVNTMLSRITPESLDEATRSSLDSAQLLEKLNQIDSSNMVRSTLYKTVSGGGEFSIGLRYPLISYNISKSLTEISFTTELANYIGLDAPIAGRYIAENDLLINNVFQINPSILVPFQVFGDNGSRVNNTDDKFFGFSIRGSASLVHGTKKFYETLKVANKPFGYYSLSFALILDRLTIQYTLMDFSNSQFEGPNYNRLQVIVTTKIGK